MFSDLPTPTQLPRRTLQMLTTASGAGLGVFFPDDGPPLTYGPFGTAENQEIFPAILDRLANTTPAAKEGRMVLRYESPTTGQEKIFVYGISVESTETVRGKQVTHKGRLFFLKPDLPAAYRDAPSAEAIDPSHLFAGPFLGHHLNILNYYIHPEDYITKNALTGITGPVLDVVRPLLFPNLARQHLQRPQLKEESLNFLKGLRSCVHAELGSTNQEKAVLHPETHHHQLQVTKLLRDFMDTIHDPGFARDFPESAPFRWLLPREAYGKNMHERIEIAGDLHDFGKLYIPKEVLLYPGRYTPELRQVMNAHAIINTRLLAPIDPLCTLLSGTHHMQNNSMTLGETQAKKKAHPGRLIPYPFYTTEQNFEVPVLGRMLSICDKADALWTSRAYQTGEPGGRSKTPPQRVALILVRCAMDGEIDPGLTKLFLQSRQHILSNDFVAPVEFEIDQSIATILHPERIALPTPEECAASSEAQQKYDRLKEEQSLYERFNQRADQRMAELVENIPPSHIPPRHGRS